MAIQPALRVAKGGPCLNISAYFMPDIAGRPCSLPVVDAIWLLCRDNDDS